MSRDTKFDNDHCPVCGHYSPGCGGMDCFDKPRICGLNAKTHTIHELAEHHAPLDDDAETEGEEK